MTKTEDFKKDKWYNITATYDGKRDVNNLKMYYVENIDGIDYQICKQGGVILSKIPLKDIAY